jgi:putative ABC transport system permease protein
MMNLRRNGANLLVLVCGVVLIAAFLFSQPWGTPRLPGGFGLPTATTVTVPQNQADFEPPSGFSVPGSNQGAQPPAGFELPAGFDPSQLPAGFDPSQLPAGFNPAQLTGGAGGGIGFPFSLILGVTSNPLVVLVPLAGLVALLVGVWSLLRPNRSRLAQRVALGAGIAAAVYFISFVIGGNALPGLGGFWLALIASVGLVGQFFIKRDLVASAQSRSSETDGAIGEAVKTTRKAPVKVEGLPTHGNQLNLSQNMGIAVDAILANKLRAGLTMLGVVIGVGSVVAMISVGQGATSGITDSIASSGLNLLTVNSGQSQGGPPGGGGGNARTLTYSDFEVLENTLTGVDSVVTQFNQSYRIRSDSDNMLSTVRGVASNYAEANNLELQEGRFLTEAEYNGRARVVVIGSAAAETLFGQISSIGRDVRIDNLRFTVIGVLAEQDGGFAGDPNEDVYIPLSTGYRNLFDAQVPGRNDNYVSSISIEVTNLDDMDAMTARIERLIRQEHNLDADEDSDFSVSDQQSLLDIANNISTILTVLLGAIASVSLIVGGIGIMNISLVSVTERTKEIGLRKAIGARKSAILMQFLIETILLSTLGGILGVIFGVSVALIVNATGVLTAEISTDSIVLGLGFSMVVGVIFGVWPATRAAALQPIEALRYE